MQIFKCKMCGGDVKISKNHNYGQCDSCGSVMTLPKADDERIINLFNRANHFRLLNEFDKALLVYENIVNTDITSAEAHWGVVLCRYGIEYVEDLKSHKRLPTCHRTQFESILTDPDYLLALEHAPEIYTKQLYEQEAKYINEIQKSILAVSRNEEPYDIFICYKDKSDSGVRTKDSIDAQEIYYKLVDAGYRVFFSRISLEHKMGSEFEPYIFSALNSSKVMLVVGRKPENFTSVWVKNEWSRFLTLAKKDKKRLIIPCYEDMDANGLPEELSFYQGREMNKIGFVYDLLKSIEKEFKKNGEEEKAFIKPDAGIIEGPTKESLCKRGFLFLDDLDFEQADEYFDRVLDIDPEFSPAYMGKLFALLECSNEEKLIKSDFGTNRLFVQFSLNPYSIINSVKESIDTYKAIGQISDLLNKLDNFDCEKYDPTFVTNSLYIKAIRFADKELKSKYESYVYEARKNALVECDRVIKEAQVIVEKLKETQEEQEVLHLRLQDEKEKRFLEDFLELQRKEIEAIELQNRLEEEKRYNKYRQASEDANKSKTIDALRNSERIFLELGDYQDSVKRAERCAKEARLRVKRLWKKAGICCICFVAFFVIVSTFIFPIWNYNKAQQYFSTGDYEMAMLTFENLGDYKDSEKMISDCKEEIYLEANSFYETKEYKEAFSLFLKISDYKDSLEKLDLSKYNVILQYASSFATGDVHTVGLKTDGTVKATGANYYGQCNVGSWKDIVSIDADGNVTVGLKKDGTVVVTGEILSGKDEIKSWTDIVYITLYEYCIIGVKIDGTVVAVDIADSKEPFVSGFIRTITNGWINIVTVEGNEDCIIGIKDDGGIVSTATADSYSDYDKGYVVQGEIATKDFAEVTAGNLGIYILKDNGVVYKLSRQEAPAKINGWSKIKNIDAGWSHVVGITSNGTIVATGAYGDDGACDVDSWRDIVDVSAGLWYTVGLKFDGTVVATGINDVGQCNVEDWIDIMVYDR